MTTLLPAGPAVCGRISDPEGSDAQFCGWERSTTATMRVIAAYEDGSIGRWLIAQSHAGLLSLATDRSSSGNENFCRFAWHRCRKYE